MKFGFYADEGTSLFAWRRLQDEGHDVAVYIPPDHGVEATVGDGLVKKVRSPAALGSFVGKNGIIVFDGNKASKDADSFRSSGYIVLNGGSFQHKLENDRSYGIELAREIGIAVPPYKTFNTLSDAARYARSHKEKSYYFKSDKYLESDATRHAKTTQGLVQYLEWLRKRFGNDIPCMLQQEIEGVALSTAWYWNGHAIIGPVEGTIEHKKYLDGDIGPSTGCSMNVVWFYRGLPKIAEGLHLDKLQEIFRREKAPPGIYDINAVIAKRDGTPYFLEWTPRFGYDSEPTAQLLVSGTLGGLYAGVALGISGTLPVSMDGAAYSFRLGIPPYPWEFAGKDRKKTSNGAPVPINPDAPLWQGFIGYSLRKSKGKIEIADEDGLVGLAAASGTSLEQMHNQAMRIAQKLDIQALSYRTDGAAVLGKDLAEVRRLGYNDVPRL
jgi:phosphoribosylamine-glycine ligase